MVREGRGRLFQRKDDKFLIYVPKDLCTDSGFPFRNWKIGARGGGKSIHVKISFTNGASPKMTIEPWTEPES